MNPIFEKSVYAPKLSMQRAVLSCAVASSVLFLYVWSDELWIGFRESRALFTGHVVLVMLLLVQCSVGAIYYCAFVNTKKEGDCVDVLCFVLLLVYAASLTLFAASESPLFLAVAFVDGALVLSVFVYVFYNGHAVGESALSRADSLPHSLDNEQPARGEGIKP